MKFLLATVNTRYIYPNLGVYSLRAYAEMRLKWEDGRGKEGFFLFTVSANKLTIEIGEYTISNQMDMVLKDICQRQPDALRFSCYIWNINYAMELVHDTHEALPGCDIQLGGPEVSHNARVVLHREPMVTDIMKREGEETLARLVEYYVNQNAKQVGTNALTDIAELTFRGGEGTIREDSIQSAMSMNRISFPCGNLTGYEHKIICYESSCGYPFPYSYCSPSTDKSVRFRDLELMKRGLAFFLEYKVLQVKFVDRTFNYKKSHAMAVWRYLLEHDNGVTNLHFEISVDLLNGEELSLIGRMRLGLIQLEIGMQTTNPDTIREIRRAMDLEELSAVVARISGFSNIHRHLDLIAELPYEGYEQFQQSFNNVYVMRPEQFQLGLLEVLKGSYMEEMAGVHGSIYKEESPYEVLPARWLSYGEILKLKAVEEMVEAYCNSGRFRTTMVMLEEESDSPFRIYEELAGEYESFSLLSVGHNRLARYEILFQFTEKRYHRLKQYRDSFMHDLYLRENAKSCPSFAREQTTYKTIMWDFFIKEVENPYYLMGYESYDSKQMNRIVHVEVMGNGSLILFDYLDRDPLNYNVEAAKISVM